MTKVTDKVELTRHGRVAVLNIDNPPVNALSLGVRQGLVDGVGLANSDASVAAIVIACAGRTFIAGADITEFDKPFKGPHYNEVMAAIEGSTKPVVAAIHGTALGGGLETALASNYRVALPSARFGFPEVKIGLLPGAGGTQRLPRLVGAERALELIVGAEQVDARQALALGLIDEIADDELGPAALAFAERIAERRPLPRVSGLTAKVAADRGRPSLFADYRKANARAHRGLKAPEACIQTIEAAVALPFAEGLTREAELSAGLWNSPEAKAQQYVFFAERAAAKVKDVPADTPVRQIRQAAVLGAGTMGGGIAMCFANAGIPVALVESNRAALERGMGVIRRNYEATAAKGRLSAADVERRMALIAPSLELAGIAGADLVVEAVFEDMALKQEVFRQLDAIARPGTILATNTSTLDVNAIAAATGRPADVLGMHFFSPANVMRLMEVVRGKATAKPVIASVLALAKRLGKAPAVVGVCDGFVGNRMLARRGREADRLILEGASPQQVDKVLYDFGFPMGPFAMADLAGIDVGWRVRQARGTTSPVADRLYALGRHGQKTGAGWYRYATGSRQPEPDPAVDTLIAEAAESLQIRRRAVSDQEILERCLYPMVNEGARILAEGIAAKPGDIDVIWVYGYGFPVYRGGPMHWADAVGLGRLVDGMRGYAASLGEQWQPAPLLAELAAKGQGFAGLAR
ncbi:MAG: 3-hydroxyacyl-CoA dehydrogenase [Alphaproteobacteria bacterium]|nr:3-hydroxyacyl-CoA dehydrogenase [Alphaproteobacteria bacterium]